MQKFTLLFLSILSTGLAIHAQTTRYFEFTTNCGHGNWQDTAFVAATSDQGVIDSVLANLNRPLEQRQFINGPIAAGDSGHNHNANHWFLWHFVSNEWALADFAIEVCDGCPYSDVDADTAYWIGTLGQFCPWSGKPVREVTSPLGTAGEILQYMLSVYPVPSNDKINLVWNGEANLSIALFNMMGAEMYNLTMEQRSGTVDVSELPAGVYFLKAVDGHQIGVRKIIVGNN